MNYQAINNKRIALITTHQIVFTIVSFARRYMPPHLFFSCTTVHGSIFYDVIIKERYKDNLKNDMNYDERKNIFSRFIDNNLERLYFINKLFLYLRKIIAFNIKLQ